MAHSKTTIGALGTGGDAGQATRKFVPAREKIVGSVSSDAGPFTGNTYPLDKGLVCNTFDTAWVYATFSGGGSVVLTPRVFDAEVGATGLWLPFLKADGTVYATPSLTTNLGLFEVRVAEQKRVFFFVTVTGTVTDLELWAIPGQRGKV
jgi:hypothetical protein